MKQRISFPSVMYGEHTWIPGTIYVCDTNDLVVWHNMWNKLGLVHVHCYNPLSYITHLKYFN